MGQLVTEGRGAKCVPKSGRDGRRGRQGRQGRQGRHETNPFVYVTPDRDFSVHPKIRRAAAAAAGPRD